MNTIKIPEQSSQNIEAIQPNLTGNAFALVFDINSEENRIGLMSAISNEASEETQMEAAGLISMITGILLLPPEKFNAVCKLSGQALMDEAKANEEFAKTLEYPENDEDDTVETVI